MDMKRKKIKYVIYLILVIIFLINLLAQRSCVKKAPSPLPHDVAIEVDTTSLSDTSISIDIPKDTLAQEIANITHEAAKTPAEFEMKVKEDKTIKQDLSPSNLEAKQQIQETNTEQEKNLKVLEIKDIALSNLSNLSQNQKNKVFPGGDEVLKGELFLLLRDNIKELKIQKDIEVIELEFFVNDLGEVDELKFKMVQEEELKKIIQQQVLSINSWDINYYKKNHLHYRLKILLL